MALPLPHPMNSLSIPVSPLCIHILVVRNLRLCCLIFTFQFSLSSINQSIQMLKTRAIELLSWMLVLHSTFHSFLSKVLFLSIFTFFYHALIGRKLCRQSDIVLSGFILIHHLNHRLFLLSIIYVWIACFGGLSLYFGIYFKFFFVLFLIEQHDRRPYNILITLNLFLGTFYSFLNLEKKNKPSPPKSLIQTYPNIFHFHVSHCHFPSFFYIYLYLVTFLEEI